MRKGGKRDENKIKIVRLAGFWGGGGGGGGDGGSITRDISASISKKGLLLLLCFTLFSFSSTFSFFLFFFIHCFFSTDCFPGNDPRRVKNSEHCYKRGRVREQTP